MTSSAPPKCWRQKRWLMTATGPSGVAPPSSAGVSIRPRRARTPSTSKKSPLTYAPSTSAVRPPCVRSKGWADHEAVEDGKQRRIGANAERQRADLHQREARVPAQPANRHPEVLPHLID